MAKQDQTANSTVYKGLPLSISLCERVNKHARERGCQTFAEAVRDLVRLGLEYQASKTSSASAQPLAIADQVNVLRLSYAKRRNCHFGVDRLPGDLSRRVALALTEGVWPTDYQGRKAGQPTYSDIAKYVQSKGFSISKSALGRYRRHMQHLAREAGKRVVG